MTILYVGPGMGGGMIAAILGIFLSIIGGLVAIVWYPIKRLFKKKKPAVKEERNTN